MTKNRGRPPHSPEKPAPAPETDGPFAPNRLSVSTKQTICSLQTDRLSEAQNTLQKRDLTQRINIKL